MLEMFASESVVEALRTISERANEVLDRNSTKDSSAAGWKYTHFYQRQKEMEA